MLLIRPLLRASDNRRHNVHVVVFLSFGGQYRRRPDPDWRPAAVLGFLRA